MRHRFTAMLRALLLPAAALLTAACGQGPDQRTAVPFDHRHALFDEVLRTHVRQGRVDYAALQRDPSKLDRYLEGLDAVTGPQYRGWSRQQKLAFWINAYNAFTLKVIIDHYPIGRSLLADPMRRYPADSIRQIPGVWKLRWWKVMGGYYTLDHMEHVILRQEIVEPRIHFVLVCASLGCPLLENRAFDAAHIEERLDRAAYNYIYRDHKVEIDRENGMVRLPRIFEWFWRDFKTFPETRLLFARHPLELAGPLSWIDHYANARDREFLRSGTYEVEFLYYDWGLNDRE